MNDFIPGVSAQHAAAGFGGGLAYLRFAPPAGKLAALGAIAVGVTIAMFMTPVVAEVLASPSFLNSPLTPRAELGLAFLLGLTGMITIPAILGMVTWIRDNVTKVMRRILGLPEHEEKPTDKTES